LHTGTKTPLPVPFGKAKAVYDKLVASKMAKGYTPGEDGTPYAHTENEQRTTGILPQLLNAVDEAEAEKLLDDPAYWMQEKLDGRRVLLRKDEAGQVTGINRKGLTIGLPALILECARSLPGTFIIDGEAVGDKFFAFDCLSRNGVDWTNHAYRDRLKVLMEFVGTGVISCVPTAAGPGDKRDLFNFLRQGKKEGVVFKRTNSPYTPGRPNSGGPQLKFKFLATCSAIVAPGRAGKRSVGLELLDGQKRVGVGNVTIPPRVPIPRAGSVVETKYLYAYPGGSLYQPVFLGVRDDVDPTACTVSQLKFKASSEDDEA
jgi:bifunctional non-homologous end joining protein LigD